MLIRTYVVGHGITVRHKSRSLVGVVYFGGVARRLRLRPACCQRSHPTSRRRGTNVTALGCEGQLFVSFYVFGSGFNEANEPSSACRLWRHHRVETGAPPRERARGDSFLKDQRSRDAEGNLGRNRAVERLPRDRTAHFACRPHNPFGPRTVWCGSIRILVVAETQVSPGAGLEARPAVNRIVPTRRSSAPIAAPQVRNTDWQETRRWSCSQPFWLGEPSLSGIMQLTERREAAASR